MRGPLHFYRGTGADLPFADVLRAHPGVRMEGYFWRFTAPRGDGRALIALCGVNQADDGPWSTLGLAAHPGGFLRAVEHPEASADPERLGAFAGAAFAGAEGSLHVDLGSDARLDVSITEPMAELVSVWGSGSYSAGAGVNQGQARGCSAGAWANSRGAMGP